MSILSTLAAYQTPLLLLLTIFGPSLLPFVTRRHTSSNQLPPQPPRSPLPPTIKALLILHTVYHIFQLLYPPYDLFVSHSIPIITSHASLRSTVLARAQTSTLHPSRTGKTHPLLELLLTRLQNLDTRLLYVRFGHRSLLTCVWCQDVNDFLLASLSGILGPYVGEAMVIGLMGWSWVGGGDAELRAASWRVGFAWGLGWMAVVEVGVRYLWDLRVVNGDCLHLSNTIHTLRTLTFLLLPIIYIFINVPKRAPPLTSLIPALSNAHSTYRLTSLSRTAIARDPRLRHAWARIGEAESRAAKIGREDGDVVARAKELGLENGEMRDNARRWIDQGWHRLIRVESDHHGI